MNLNRRQFLGSLIGGLAAAAAVRTWPFRVFSFPPAVVEPNFDAITATTLAELRADILYDNFFVDTPFMKYLRQGTKLVSSHPRMQSVFTGITVPTDDEVEIYS